jgi:hypothetical protein
MTNSEPPRHQPAPRRPGGCVSALLVLAGLVMLLPGVCVIIYVADRPGQLFAQGAGVLWNFLLIGAAGVAVIVLAIRLSMRQ